MYNVCTISGQCSISPQISGIIKWCTGPYSMSSEDTASYDVGWKPLPNSTNNVAQVFNHLFDIYVIVYVQNRSLLTVMHYTNMCNM